ncbi:hypothetical protein VVR12_06530 [Rothia sp. LK2588]|uniref:hypothetical protein n=1 Tax=Rothia sp. LK2588 TaxID=3114369 RepID=UPI0034CD7685
MSSKYDTNTKTTGSIALFIAMAGVFLIGKPGIPGIAGIVLFATGSLLIVMKLIKMTRGKDKI